MDSLETGDQLIIVNRSTEHRISKKLICKILYFEKMLNLDLKESKENKVVLDFDEKAFKSIFNWIKLGFIFIEMDCVINMSIMADYFGISDRLMNNFISYFHENFSIEHLPVIIPQVTSTSKLINSGALYAFICRYFLKIVNTPVWLNYPPETIGRICGLDLMIHSEYQVFDAIMRWVKAKADYRKHFLKILLSLIRWCHLEDEDLAKIKENSFFKFSNFEIELCSRNKPNCNCGIDRTKQGCFVVIEELSDKKLQVKVLDGNFFPLVNQLIQNDPSLPLHLPHEEHVSDIFFDSGKEIIRIDWKHNKYRYMDYKSHYQKVHNCIYKSSRRGEYYAVTTKPELELFCRDVNFVCPQLSLLEANEKFILVLDDFWRFRCWETPSMANFNDSKYNVDSYLATVLDNYIYIVTEKALENGNQSVESLIVKANLRMVERNIKLSKLLPLDLYQRTQSTFVWNVISMKCR
ncbi:uncharacterized protein LOC107370987 isoform X2 [Tetranychus urticae]|uniref:uncharacterized protein LOC107370987 isoform X2 n=1 Tax=Tetranychus urticae TaxID=32264 RepID=UPI00077BEBFD|nr:uncharacterized protein LOC107370987 isoform X2 [Tetranychus urticae]